MNPIWLMVLFLVGLAMYWVVEAIWFLIDAMLQTGKRRPK